MAMMRQNQESAETLSKRVTTVLNSLIVDKRSNVAAETLRGYALGTETYVRVRWGWAILPCVIVVSSFLFLAMTVSKSKRKEQLYMSSALTGYFHGLDGWTADELSAMRSNTRHRDEESTLLQQSKLLKARLKRNADGDLRLVKDD
jgi:hypothetical protein